MVYTGRPSKGCATCRKRRIKCDEKLPGCGGCARVNQECPGYANHFDLAWRDQTTVAKKGVERGKAKRKAAREELERKERERRRERASVSSLESSSNNNNSTTSIKLNDSNNNSNEILLVTGLHVPGSYSPLIQAPLPHYDHSSSEGELVFTPESDFSSNPESPELYPGRQDSSNTPLPLDPYETILRPIPQEQALCFFFNHYVLPIRDPLARKGFLEYLGPLYSQAESASPIKMSTLAIATCMMSSRMGQPADTPLSRSFYVQAVSRIKDRVASQQDCTSDELISAVMLLQYYEASTGYLTKRTSNPNPHLDGAVALIRHRGPWNFQGPASRSILLYVRSMLVEPPFSVSECIANLGEIDASFRNHSLVPPDVETWADYVPVAEQIPVFRFDTINMKLAKLRVSLPNFIYSPPSDTKSYEIQKAMVEGIEIDKQLTEWSNTLPESWMPTRVTREDGISPTLQLYQDHCDVYKTLFLASTWNKLRLSQIEVKQVFLKCLAQQPQTPRNIAHQDIYKQEIQLLADDICASVPFYLGDRMKAGRSGDPYINYPQVPGRPPVMDHYQTGPSMGGQAILQPLGTLTRMDIELRAGQREWLIGQIARTARIYNIVQWPRK